MQSLKLPEEQPERVAATLGLLYSVSSLTKEWLSCNNFSARLLVYLTVFRPHMLLLLLMFLLLLMYKYIYLSLSLSLSE